MANIEVQDLTAITTCLSSDVLLIISDPTVTPLSRKITVANLCKGFTTVDITAKSFASTNTATDTGGYTFNSNAAGSYIFRGNYSGGSTTLYDFILKANGAMLYNKESTNFIVNLQPIYDATLQNLTLSNAETSGGCLYLARDTETTTSGNGIGALGFGNGLTRLDEARYSSYIKGIVEAGGDARNQRLEFWLPSASEDSVFRTGIDTVGLYTLRASSGSLNQGATWATGLTLESGATYIYQFRANAGGGNNGHGTIAGFVTWYDTVDYQVSEHIQTGYDSVGSFAASLSVNTANGAVSVTNNNTTDNYNTVSLRLIRIG